jgi:hypothetical protein
MDPLQSLKTTDANGVTRIVLKGAIDELADLSTIFAGVQTDAVVDFEHVERMNSIGISRWLGEVWRFTANHRLHVEGLSYAVVLQANSIKNLFGLGEIRSCMAPYYCPACQANQLVKVLAQEVTEPRAPVKHCAKCQGALIFDELDDYFTFWSTPAQSSR